MRQRKDMELRSAIINYWSRRRWISPHFVTLTLKEWSCEGGILRRIGQLDAEQNLQHGLNVIRKKVVKLGFPKHERLMRLAIFEGGDNGHRPHYHLLLDKPACIDTPALTLLIEREWPRTRWGHQKVAVEACYAPLGCLTYMAKLSTKECYATSIDWINSA